MKFWESVDAQTQAIEQAGLLRATRTVSGTQGPEIVLDGRRVINLCSNDYLGLASHPALLDAAQQSLQEDGLGASSSRLIAGTMAPHVRAEHALAGFSGFDQVLLFSSGYTANLAMLSGLLGPEDVVLSDALNHASIIDGCRLSRARVLVYRHRDVDHARQTLREHRAGARRAIVVTESVFSMDGDSAPLRDLRALCDDHDAALCVDEAHALGVLGPSGRGLCAALQVEPDVLVGTLGKAFGVAGGFLAGPPRLRSLLQSRGRPFVYTTAPPPLLASAAVTATRLVARADAARARLVDHAGRLRESLRSFGFDVPAGEAAIVPVILGSVEATLGASQRLLEAGVFVQAIRPPTVAAGTSRLRVVPTAAHSERHVERALRAFENLSRAL
jgi:8-amino-7-oxononanoate synthase